MDDRAYPQEKNTDYRNGNHYDNDRVPKSPKENLILKQFYVIAKTNKISSLFIVESKKLVITH